MNGFPIKNNVPQYVFEIPSTKSKVAFRPFLVGEHKSMMLALATEDTDTIVNAIKELVHTCSSGKVNPETLSTFDLEYLFLKLRAKSIGDNVSLSIECGRCEKDIPFKINIDEIEVDFSTKIDNKIQISPSIGVVMRYPSLAETIKLYEKTPLDEILLAEIAGNCITDVWNEEEMVSTKDYNREVLDEFLNTLTIEQLKKLTQFVLLTPSVKMNKVITCPHCKTDNKVLIEGIENFFG